jgi:HEAT repeat protein
MSMDEERARTAAWELTSDDPKGQSQGYRVLKEIGGAAVAVLLEVAHEWDERRQAKWLGIFASGSPTDSLIHAINDSNAVEALETSMADPNPRFRRFAVAALSKIDDTRVPDLLAGAMTDEDAVVRQNAIYGLMSLGDQRSADLLLAATQDPDERVRSAAARGLRRIGGPDVADTLIAMLNDPSEMVAESASISLGHLGIDRAVQPLIDALQSDRKHLVQSSARALAQVGDPRAVGPLIDLLRTSEDHQLFSRAATALEKFNLDSEVESLATMIHDPDIRRRRLAVGLLGHIHDDRIPDILAQALQDDDPKTVRSAALGMASHGDRRTFDILTDMLQIRTGPDSPRHSDKPYIRVAAAKALGKLGDPRAAEPLADALSDPSVELAAASSLVKLGDGRGLAHLLSMLASDDPRRRHDADAAIAESADPRAEER